MALLSFSNAIVVARSFAAKGSYEIDVDQGLIALGACQIAAGLSQVLPSVEPIPERR